jgi:hypothetical protein
LKLDDMKMTKEWVAKMSTSINLNTLNADEREEVLMSVAETLETNAREAFFEGNQQFAAISNGIAQAIFVNLNELATGEAEAAANVLNQASEIISQFKASHPFPMVSMAIH